MTLTKSIFRKKCLNKIKNSSQHNKLYKSYLLEKKLQYELKNIKYKSILFYYPLKSEIDIRKTLQKLRKKNTIYVPFMEEESFKMVPFRLPLKKKRFGIFEAGNTNKKINKIDIAIVPTIGVDGSLQRIGFGKGMYDRFFAKLKKKPYTIFIQEKFCYTKELICDEYDISCDLLLTPKEEIKRC
jgi:5-formyltetrahydrofolate cyclo-ligase